MLPSGIVSREKTKHTKATKENKQTSKLWPFSAFHSPQASLDELLLSDTGCPQHCWHVTSDCRFSPQKEIQKNMTGNTAENTAPIAPTTMGASTSLPVSSRLICNPGHCIALKHNSLLSVKHTRGDGCGVVRVPQQAHMHTAMPP